MKNLILALLITLTLACGGKDGGSTKTDCPSGKDASTAPGICVPRPFLGGQINRTDGGWILIESQIDQTFHDCIGAAVVAGLTKTVAGNPFPVYRNTGEYQVIMVNKMATNQDGTPALLVRGSQTAGTVINTYSDCTRKTTPTIVLPIPDRFDDAYFSYLEYSAWYEGEHAAEWVGDPCYTFQQYTGPNDVHPHRPLPNAPVGLMTKPFACAVRSTDGPEWKR